MRVLRGEGAVLLGHEVGVGVENDVLHLSAESDFVFFFLLVTICSNRLPFIAKISDASQLF